MALSVVLDWKTAKILTEEKEVTEKTHFPLLRTFIDTKKKSETVVHLLDGLYLFNLTKIVRKQSEF